MKIAVLVIANNEERHIGECIDSLRQQTLIPDEIVVINHNSTDRTGEIARTFPVTVIDYAGPVGSVHARIHGFEALDGADIILCIDGDSYARKNWVETMSALLMKPGQVLVGSWVRLIGTLYFFASALYWYPQCVRPEKATEFIWGASFGIRGTHKKFAIAALQKSMTLSYQLELAYNPDDYWLALFMHQHGGLEITNKTWVTAHAKESNSLQCVRRGIAARRTRRKIEALLRTQELPSLDNLDSSREGE